MTVGEYLNVKCLVERTNFDYINLNLLQGEFSSDASNDLLEQMHNHIGHIWKVFPQCAFSNVSPNRLPEQMHNHIGRICVTFILETIGGKIVIFT